MAVTRFSQSRVSQGLAKGSRVWDQVTPSNITVDYLIVAGGGGTGRGNGTSGGGGAGGLRSTVTATGRGGALETAASLARNIPFTITVGGGGAGSTDSRGTNGNNSSMIGDTVSITSLGGGGSGGPNPVQSGLSGGSGGGGGEQLGIYGVGGAGTTGQGYDGSQGGGSPAYRSGGGGGAGANGSSVNANGGIGVQITDFATPTSTGANSGYYAGGGGGGGGTGGTGGLGGGGTGSSTGTGQTNGSTNTGGGAGGAYVSNGSTGGSGIVLIRYPGSQVAYGGTVNTTGGYTYHKFLSSSVFYTGLALPVSGASLWLDASDDTRISFSGSNVTNWLDKSGNGHNFTAPSGKEPLYVTNLQNGLPGIRFFPSSAIKYLTNTSLSNWSENTFTAFFVFNSTSSAGNYPALLGRNSLTAFQMGGNNAGPSALSISKIGNATQNSSLSYTGTTADVAVYKATAASSTSVTVQTYKNGVAATSTITQGTIASAGDKNSIGASVDGAGDSMAPLAYLCEIILYPSALSDTDRNKVEGYLKAKWGTP